MMTAPRAQNRGRMQRLPRGDDRDVSRNRGRFIGRSPLGSACAAPAGKTARVTSSSQCPTWPAVFSPVSTARERNRRRRCGFAAASRRCRAELAASLRARLVWQSDPDAPRRRASCAKDSRCRMQPASVQCRHESGLQLSAISRTGPSTIRRPHRLVHEMSLAPTIGGSAGSDERQTIMSIRVPSQPTTARRGKIAEHRRGQSGSGAWTCSRHRPVPRCPRTQPTR